ncbi:MAG: methylated-DNA--[protein]-cysteine S-methyltransferase [Alphaproteobacteria bacterium]|nr:methylated-DNA--[protein]-cysteine S-methyltransferase [Alphaproteobacteria bacterium]
MPRHGVASPFGVLTIVECDGAIAALQFPESQRTANSADAAEPTDPAAGGDAAPTALLARAADQLTRYFNHGLTDFDLPFVPASTPFQQRVRDAMLAIPFGETRSYGALAKSTGGAPRAIGQACGRNPIPIIVPCHRVVAAGGRLGGFSGGDGLPTKRRLLAHEGPSELFANLP